MEKSGKQNNLKNGKIKWCSYHHSNGHSSKDHYQEQSESANLDNKKIRCSYNKSRLHSDDEHHHQRYGSRNSLADSKNTKYETFVADSTETGCDRCSCNRKVKKRKCTETNDEPNNTPTGIWFSFTMYHPLVSQDAGGFHLSVVVEVFH